jgi:hypothetical protein
LIRFLNNINNLNNLFLDKMRIFAFMALSKSAQYFRTHPKARKKKQKLTAKLNKLPAAVKKRVESNKKQRQAKAAGRNVNGMHFDHAVSRFVSAKTNMGRKGEGGRKKGTRKR